MRAPVALALPVVPLLKGQECSKHHSKILSLQLQHTGVSQP